MWEKFRLFPRGRLSLRPVSLCVTSLIVALFATIAIVSTPVYAVDAVWQGESISYNGKTYQKASVLPAGQPAGTVGYTATSGQVAEFIFFPSADAAKTASSATLVSYQSTSPGVYTGGGAAQTIAISPTTNPAGIASNSTRKTTSCDGTFTFGVGWIVCPVSNFLAGAMDWLFEQLSNFLVVRPAQTTTESALYRGWAIMRNIANLCFVIAFMIIIYSQITSVGLSNYGIKRMLPRLVVAALLVNLSYWICALAIDVSNILGYSIHDMFVGIRKSLVGPESNNWQLISWKNLTTAILTGGAAMGGLAVFFHTSVAGPESAIGASIYMLVPILVAVILAVLVALIIMAARQALITILVIISPLAFVAYLLPNTEKYFDRWRETFIKMLLLFPIFSIIFGGSQVAGMAIIQNSTTIVMIILGMAVQVAPVVITPLLIKFSGSLLGRIAGIVNNPQKGILDRTRNWAKERADLQNAKVRSGYDENKVFAAFNRRSRKYDRKRRERQGLTSAYESKSQTAFDGTSAGRAIAALNKDVEEDKRAIQARVDRDHAERKVTVPYYIDREFKTRDLESDIKSFDSQLSRDFERSKLTNATRLRTDMAARASEDEAKAASERIEAMYGEYRSGAARLPGSATTGALSPDAIESRLQAAANDLAQDASRKDMANRKQLMGRAAALKAETTEGEALRRYAAGVLADDGGMISVMAGARKTSSKLLVEDIQNIEDTTDQLLKTDRKWIFNQLAKKDLSLGERVAYSNMLARQGGPGVDALKQTITYYEDNIIGRANIQTSADLQDFKDFMSGNSSFTGAGKDLEFWANNNRNPSTGQLQSFDEVTKSSGTWGNISAENMTTLNVASQYRALNVLYKTNRAKYDDMVESLRKNEDLLFNRLKPVVRDKIKAGNWDDLPSDNYDDYNKPIK